MLLTWQNLSELCQCWRREAAYAEFVNRGFKAYEQSYPQIVGELGRRSGPEKKPVFRFSGLCLAAHPVIRIVRDQWHRLSQFRGGAVYVLFD